MKGISIVLSTIIVAAALMACEEEIESSKAIIPQDSAATIVELPPPTVSAIESQIPTTLKFGFEVAPDHVQDTVHYLILRDTAEVPTGERLLAHQNSKLLPMDGNYFRAGAQPDLPEQTQFVVYALLKRNEHFSGVTSVAIATGTEE